MHIGCDDERFDITKFPVICGYLSHEPNKAEILYFGKRLELCEITVLCNAEISGKNVLRGIFDYIPCSVTMSSRTRNSLSTVFLCCLSKSGSLMEVCSGKVSYRVRI